MSCNCQFPGFVNFEEMDRMVADRSDGIDLAFERAKGSSVCINYMIYLPYKRSLMSYLEKKSL